MSRQALASTRARESSGWEVLTSQQPVCPPHPQPLGRGHQEFSTRPFRVRAGLGPGQGWRQVMR